MNHQPKQSPPRGRKLLATLGLSIVAVFGLAHFEVEADPTRRLTGVTIKAPFGPRFLPGMVVFNTVDGPSYAVDMHGEIRLAWESPDKTSELGYTRPLGTGNVLAKVDSDPDRLVEMDQDGNIVWESVADKGTTLHHDWERLPNGDTLILCSREILVPEISSEMLIDDCLLIVQPDGSVVWDWQTADHFDDFDFSAETKLKIAEHAGDWAHANSASSIPENTSHTDSRFQPGNIILSYRFINAVAIVDIRTGDIVWRTEDSLTIGQHNAYMIPDGHPGGGHILIFDNGFGGHYNNGGSEVMRAESRVVEIDPTLVGTGQNPIIWEYNATLSGFPKYWFFSHFLGSAQRLRNSNTLIVEGSIGRVFEVTREGQIVWEYINPFLTSSPPTNRIYRAMKVPATWLESAD